MSRRVIPKRLDDELRNLPKYKPVSEKAEFQEKAKKIVDDMTDVHAVERAAFAEIFGPLPSSRRNSASKPAPAKDVETELSTASNANDNEFSNMLLSRLTRTEMESKQLRRQLAETLKRVESLDSENKNLKMLLRDYKKNSVEDEIMSLRRENSGLIRKLADMEQFLSDYGLVWVGQPSAEGEHDYESENVVRHMMDYETFARKIQELNDIVCSEPTQIKKENGPFRRARLVRAEELVDNILITYYRNGLMVKRGPFRPINSDSYFTFMKDITDGFFPSEFRKEYPDGVLLDLKDMHTVDYNDNDTNSSSNGMNNNAMSQAQLLSKLPKIVVRNGMVINIRDEVEAKLNHIRNSNNSKNTENNVGYEHHHNHNEIDAADKQGSNRQSSENQERHIPEERKVIHISPSKPTSSTSIEHVSKDTESSRMATVQVRWLQGSTVLVVKVPYNGCVGEIRQDIIRHFGASAPVPDFELRSAYPPRLLTDNMTLEEAGLLPNGTVHAKRIG